MKAGGGVALILLAGAAAFAIAESRRVDPQPKPQPKPPQPKPPSSKPPSSAKELIDPWSDDKPPPMTMAKRSAWVQVIGPMITLDYRHQFAAVIQLSGMEATWGNSEDVVSKLREFAKWEALDVWGAAADVPKSMHYKNGGPFGAVQDAPGRFWATGIPSRGNRVFGRPDQIEDLWSRQIYKGGEP